MIGDGSVGGCRYSVDIKLKVTLIYIYNLEFVTLYVGASCGRLLIYQTRKQQRDPLCLIIANVHDGILYEQIRRKQVVDKIIIIFSHKYILYLILEASLRNK